MNKALVLSVAMVASSAFAETLVFAPAEGETTNVTAFLTGTLDVSANPGASGGGTVRISGHYNNYVGTTANNCGILWPAFFGPDSSYGSLGACTGLTLGQGTLKYTGQAGVITAPVTHTGGVDDYSVYDIGEGSDLTLAGEVKLDARLVKKGKGTLHFSHAGASSFFPGGSLATPAHINGGYRLAFSENGDAPTCGGAGITVAEGTVSFDEGAYTLGSGFSLHIGANTAAEGEQETEGTLDVRGAALTINGDVNIGVHNGFTTTTPDYRPSSALRVYSGSLSFLNKNIFFGRNYYDPTRGLVVNTNPRFEIHGGTVSGLIGMQMGNIAGTLSEILVDGGALTFTATMANYGITTGNLAGDGSSTNIVSVSGSGEVNVRMIKNGRGETLFLKLLEGGRLTCGYLTNAEGNLVVFADGGTLLKGNDADRPLADGTVDRIVLGAKGLTVGATRNGNQSSAFVAEVACPIVSQDGLDGVDGGLTVAGTSGWGAVKLSAVNAYAGPTTVERGLCIPAVAGALPSESELRLVGGELRLVGEDQTVEDVTIGCPDKRTSPAISVVKGHPLTVTGSVTAPGPVLVVTGFADQDLTAAAAGEDFDVIVAPLSQKTVLESLAAKCAFGVPTADLAADFSVIEKGDQAVLVMSVVSRAQAVSARDALLITSQTVTVPAGVSHLASLVFDYDSLYGAVMTLTLSGDVVVDQIESRSLTPLKIAGTGTLTIGPGEHRLSGDLTVSGKVVLDVYGSVDLGDTGVLKPSGSAGSAVYLHDGVVLRIANLTDGTTSCGVYADGATIRLAHAGNPEVTFGNSQSYLYIGKGGLSIDVGEQNLDVSDLTSFQSIGCRSYGHMSKDPSLSSEEKDGGVHVIGGGCYSREGTFAAPSSLTFTKGSVHVVRANNVNLTMLPGSTLRSSFTTAATKIAGFDLGQDGATEAVHMEIPVTATTVPPFYINYGDGDTDMYFRSPVEVSVVEDPTGWKGAATCPPGVYTGIVYQTWIQKSPDITQFVLPEKYRATRKLTTTTGTIKFDNANLGCIVFTIEDISGPQPPPPDPYVDVTVGPGEKLTLDNPTTIGSLRLAAGSWATPSIVGSFGVTNLLSLGLLPGEVASARVDGDVTIKSGCVWTVDYDADARAADLLVVNGKLTVEKGATLDFGRTDANPLPRHFRAPIACATGAIAVPARVAATGTGGLCESMELTVENGVLYASEPKRGLMILVR